VNPENWSPFIPAAGSGAESVGAEGGGASPSLLSVLTGIEQQSFGVGGIITGAAIVFFAYIGFDIVATTAEEARNPQRDLPIGILGSLAISTILYILVSQIMTGIVPYNEIDTAAPMASVFQDIGLNWAAGLVSIGALAGLTSVVMILMLGQSRVAFAMSRDNLLPRILARTHPRFRTPYIITIITGVFVAIIAAFVELGDLAELVNIGTLFAFILVSIGTVILRRTQPDLPRAFKTPLLLLVAPLAVLFCLYLMLALPTLTWTRFLIWMAAGIVIYFAYSRSHSRLGRTQSGENRRED